MMGGRTGRKVMGGGGRTNQWGDLCLQDFIFYTNWIFLLGSYPVNEFLFKSVLVLHEFRPLYPFLMVRMK